MLQVTDAMHSRSAFSLSDVTDEPPAQIVPNGTKKKPQPTMQTISPVLTLA